MAEPADISRQVGDVQPNNFVNPGVVDNSLSGLVKTVGEVGLAVDKTLAKERFGDAIETLRTQYLTGVSAAEAAQGGAAQADDDGPDFVPTAVDNKALSDFGKTLDMHQQAVVQGRRSQDMFRISAERLYRTAISKRPGLAQEFRQVAAGFLGFDVVGATTDIAARQDDEFLKSQAAASKTKAEQGKDLIKRQREVWEKVYPASAFVPDEQWAAYTATKMPHFMQMSEKAAAADAAGNEMKLLELQGKKSAEADERFYVTSMDGIRASFDSSIDAAMAQASQPDANGSKLTDSPQGMRQVMTGLRGQLLAEVAKVDQAVSGRDVSPDAKSRYRTLIDSTLTRLDNVLSLKDDADFMDRANNMLKAESVRSIYNNEEARQIAAMDSIYGDTVMNQFMKDNGKTLTLAMSQVVTNSMSPNQVTKVAARTASQLIAGIWKDGGKTPPDPMATTRAAGDIATMLSKFYLQDDSNFRPQDFTEWQGTKGILPVLTSRARIIRASLSDEESGQIAAQGAAAIGNSALRLMGLLAKKSPALVDKLDLESVWAPDTPGLAKVKAGQKLSPSEQVVLDHFGKQFNRKIAADFMAAYGGGTPQESWDYVASQVKPMVGLKQSMTQQAEATSQRAQETLQGASGKGTATTPQGGSSGGSGGAWWKDF